MDVEGGKGYLLELLEELMDICAMGLSIVGREPEPRLALLGVVREVLPLGDLWHVVSNILAVKSTP